MQGQNQKALDELRQDAECRWSGRMWTLQAQHGMRRREAPQGLAQLPLQSGPLRRGNECKHTMRQAPEAA